MKLKFRKKHAHRLSKFDMFAGRYMEHDYNDEGQIHPTQLYPYQLLNGKVKNIALSKYHLIKKFGEKKKELYNYTKKKNTKQIKQLIRIHYFISLIKKTYHLVKALKKAKRSLKIWIRQMIQNEMYFLKKAIQLAKTKKQMSIILKKYEIITRTYKKIYIKYIKSIIKRYLIKTKSIKRRWKKVLTHGFTKGLKQRNNIMPFIFYLRKILFKKIRTGTLKEIKYWKRIIYKFAKRHKIMKEFDINYIINTPNREDRYQGKNVNNKTLKPYILLNYISQIKKKSRPVLNEKIKKQYYHHLINLVRKRKKKRKIKISSKIRNKLRRLAIFYSMICGKKKHILRSSYHKRRLITYVNRLAQKRIIKIDLPVIKKRMENSLILSNRISTWLILLKNWKRFRLLKKLNLIEIKNKKTKHKNKKNKYYYYNVRNNARVRRMLKRLRKRIKKDNPVLLKALKTYTLEKKNNLQKYQKVALYRTKSHLVLSNYSDYRKRKTRGAVRYRLYKFKRIWRKKMKRVAYKTPYMLTCQLHRDYTGNWIELYKKKNKYNDINKIKITDQMTSKIMSKKQKRIIRKNYRHILNDSYTIYTKHKEILSEANRYFYPTV